jgi:hypothetical protein
VRSRWVPPVISPFFPLYLLLQFFLPDRRLSGTLSPPPSLVPRLPPLGRRSGCWLPRRAIPRRKLPPVREILLPLDYARMGVRDESMCGGGHWDGRSQQEGMCAQNQAGVRCACRCFQEIVRGDRAEGLGGNKRREGSPVVARVSRSLQGTTWDSGCAIGGPFSGPVGWGCGAPAR